MSYFSTGNLVGIVLLIIILAAALVQLIRSKQSEEIDNLEAHLDRYLGRKRVKGQLPFEKSMESTERRRSRSASGISGSKSASAQKTKAGNAQKQNVRFGTQQAASANSRGNGQRVQPAAARGNAKKQKNPRAAMWFWIIVFIIIFLGRIVGD